MKKYTAKYYDKDGNLQATVKFQRKYRAQVENAALSWMGDHYAFVVFRKGRAIIDCHSAFCEVMQLPVKRIVRRTKKGFTAAEIYNVEWSMTPVSGKGILELMNNPN